MLKVASRASSAAREIFLSEPLNMDICPINQFKEPDFQN